MPCNSFLGFKDDQLALDDEEEKSCSSFDWKCAIVASLLLAVIIIGIFAAIIAMNFLSPVLKRKQILKDIERQMRREQK